jgi:two-component sensor histidine kinase
MAIIAYFGYNPSHLEYPFLASPLTVLLLFTVVGVLLGQVFHNLFKRSFIQSRKLEDTLQEKKTLLEEVHHRVKNNLQTISSMLTLQYRQQETDEKKELLKKSMNRIHSMAFLHEHLYESESLADLEFSEYVDRLCDHQQKLYSTESRVEITRDIDDFEISLDQAVTCGLLINELVGNALQHGFPDDTEGQVRVTMKRTNGSVCLTVSDDGVGAERRSFKGDNKSTGITIVRSLVEHGLEGSIEFATNGGVTAEANFSL